MTARNRATTHAAPPSDATPERVSLRPIEDMNLLTRYEPIDAIGSGGMGHVWLCRDRQIGRDVAIKSLSLDRARDATARARFLQEAVTQGQLEHPCIPPVYDIEAARGARPRFTMRYVAGATLADVVNALRRGDPEVAQRYTPRRLLTAFSAVCGAVHYAHRRGVIHRDLKPENVMLGEYGEVYVLDWGVARLTHNSSEPVKAPVDAEPATEIGALLGTPGFVAPEQWLDSGAADERSDVYSLGAMLFELLTLTALHDGATTRAVMRQTFTDPAVAPSARAPHLDITPELDRICLTATARDREQRYASARELRDEVERVLDGQHGVDTRREAAAAIADEAEALACSALSAAGSEGDRRLALERVGRALALDPESPRALATLVRLMFSPPRATPPEVREGIDADWRNRVRALARVGALTYPSWLLVVPLLLRWGVRDARMLAATTAVMLLSAALSASQALRRRPSDLAGYVLLSSSMAAISSLNLLFGPLLAVPAALTANTIIFVAHGDRMRPAVVLAAGLAAIFAPVALELAGALPPSFAFENGRLVILPRMLSFAPGATLALLAIVHAVVFVGATAAFLIARRTNRAEVERLHLLSWHLRQIVPEHARAVLDGAPVTPPAAPPAARG
ncbi:MAG: serine/threonine-protein kinase [Polyangiales bacterium]